jgi:glyoxylase-like metal-dependent hydrolase (beta-lactamase superfamily II)
MRIEPVVDCEVVVEPMHPWFRWEGGRGTAGDDWMRHPDLLEDGKLRLGFGGFLLRGGPLGDRVVLVDCGSGPDGDDFIPPGDLVGSLAAAGVRPDEVTDVLLTHLHYDHTGWLVTDGRPTFPNATVLCSAADLAWFSDPSTPGVSARVLPARIGPLGDRLSPFSTDCTVVPGIDALLAPGHTPGSTMFVISDGVRRVVLIGDVVHCPVELVEAEWAALGDVDPVLAARTRERVRRELDGAVVGGAHFPGLALGRLITTSVARRWTIS